MTYSKNLLRTLLILSFVGFLDVAYLTIKHFQNIIPPCTTGGCEVVLASKYAVVAGVPLALIGAIYYITVFLLTLNEKNDYAFWIISAGLVVSLLLFGLQIFVLHSICQYCVLSAAITLTLFIISLIARTRK